MTARNFTTLAADAFDRAPDFSPGADGSVLGGLWQSRATRLYLPTALDPYLWPGCAITRLQADLLASDMSADVQLAPAATDAPFRQLYYSLPARRSLMAAVALAGLGLLAVVYLIITRHRRWPTGSGHAVLLGLAILTAAGSVATYGALPAVPTDVHTYRWRALRDHQRDVLRAVAELEKLGRLTPANTSDPAAFRQLLQAHEDEVYAAKGYTYRPQRFEEDTQLYNPFTDAPITRGLIPGDYTLRTLDGQTWFCTYDLTMREERIPITLHATPTTAPAAPPPL